ncbi:hypothetical protein SCG7109_AB_00390 [Chlamydiales bacterium SCGC AG-110-M15]|nr:hypothetical protein SCG7109_AB_00390 [Chlamydiales bacterium SCGC AG-110-M15]
MKNKHPDIEQLKNAIKEQHSGHLQKAQKLYESFLKKQPKHARAWHFLALLHYQKGNDKNALNCMKKGLQLLPNDPSIHNDIANLYRRQNKQEDSINHFEKALQLNPKNAQAQYNYALLLAEMNQFQKALPHIQQAYKINPQQTPFIILYSSVLQELDNTNEALKLYTSSPIAKEHPILLTHHAKLLADREDCAQALNLTQKALDKDPNNPLTHEIIGFVYGKQGKIEQAISSLKRSLKLKPNNPEVHSHLIFLQDLLPGITLKQQQEERKLWNKQFIRPHRLNDKTQKNNKDPKRKLKIGFLSGDFHRHSAASGFGDLLLKYDKKAFEVYAYATFPHDDDWRARFIHNVDHWYNAYKFSDVILQKAILNDKLDILVDLAGHTRANRLLIFNKRLANIVVTGIGHLAAGIETIDYRLTTEIMTPKSEESLFIEKPIYLDSCFGFMPPNPCPEIRNTPLDTSKGIVFGCFNRKSKINETTLNLWAQTLSLAPRSSLHLKSAGWEDEQAQKEVLDLFSRYDIDASRLHFHGRSASYEHLKAHHGIDLMLDPFPCGGGISSLESLWMGVPVLTKFSDRNLAHRLGKETLLPLGLEDFIVNSDEEWLKRIQEITQAPKTLHELKRGLRDRVEERYSCFAHDVYEEFKRLCLQADEYA